MKDKNFEVTIDTTNEEPLCLHIKTSIWTTKIIQSKCFFVIKLWLRIGITWVLCSYCTRKVIKENFAFFSLPSLKYFVLKSLQVGVRTNLPDWFQLCSKELNPFDHQKGRSPLTGEKINTHTHQLKNRLSKQLIFSVNSWRETWRRRLLYWSWRILSSRKSQWATIK